MNVRDEIEKHAAEADKPALRWLFGFNHMSSEWYNVAGLTFVGKGLGAKRVWKPQGIGVLLWDHHCLKEVTLPKIKALLADAPCTCPVIDNGCGKQQVHIKGDPDCFRTRAEALLKELP